LISAIVLSRLTFYVHHGKLPSAEQLQSRFTAPGTQEYLVFNVKGKIALPAPGGNAHSLDFDQRPGRHRIAAYQLEAERERLRNHGGKFAYLKSYLGDALQPMPIRLIDYDIKQALGNSEFVHRASRSNLIQPHYRHTLQAVPMMPYAPISGE
jgi:hypothetical protein